MHIRELAILAPVAVALALATPVAAEEGHETVTPVFHHDIANIPGKTMTSVVVSYPPGVKSQSHRHAPSAFIYAYVLSGAIRSQVDDQPPKVYHAGESWFEAPGAHHVISENASATEPAQLLATFVVDSSDTVLTIPDKH